MYIRIPNCNTTKQLIFKGDSEKNFIRIEQCITSSVNRKFLPKIRFVIVLLNLPIICCDLYSSNDQPFFADINHLQTQNITFILSTFPVIPLTKKHSFL